MSNLTNDAAWVLTGAFLLSITYELYRATMKSGVSRHDSMRGFVIQLPQYGVAAAVVAALFAGADWAAGLGLGLCAVVIAVSMLYYNPRIMLERRPGVIDWVEDVVFTGLAFVAATQLTYHVFWT